MKPIWRLLNTKNNSAAMNMAIDEALMSLQDEDALPTIRFYGWTRPSFSFGYFQNISEEVDIRKCNEREIDLVRRPTGGGTVIHGWDQTYSVIAPRKYPLIPQDILASYQLISQCIIAGLRKLGVKAEYHSDKFDGDETLQDICLTNPTKYDVLIAGKKVAGAAQRRKKNALLHQGYIALNMPPDDVTKLVSQRSDVSQSVLAFSIAINSILQSPLAKEKLQAALVSGFEQTLNINLVSDSLSPDEIYTANHLARTKYETAEWMERKMLRRS